MIELNKTIKTIQREMYFVSCERDRKEKLLTKLTDDIKEEKRRKQLEIKLAAQIKNGGLFSALSKGLAIGSTFESGKGSSSSPPKIMMSQTDNDLHAKSAMSHSKSPPPPPSSSSPAIGNSAVDRDRSRSVNNTKPEEERPQFEDFTIEYDVYDMSMDDDTSVMGFQNDPASPITVAEKRKMKRQEAAALQSAGII